MRGRVDAKKKSGIKNQDVMLENNCKRRNASHPIQICYFLHSINQSPTKLCASALKTWPVIFKLVFMLVIIRFFRIFINTTILTIELSERQRQKKFLTTNIVI